MSGLYLYLDDRALVIVQSKKVSGKPQITGVFHKDITGLSLESVGQEIRAAVLVLKPLSRRVTLVLPSKYAITKNIEVPSLDKDEIESIIRLQGVRHTPYSKEELIVGHISLERIMERYTKVLLVIVSNDHMRQKTDTVELGALEIEGVHLSFEGLVRIVNEFRPIQTFESPCGLIYLGPDFTDFIIVHGGKPHYIRSVTIGARQLDDQGEIGVKQLVEEFKKTCDAYQNEDQGQPLKRVVVTGSRVPRPDLVKTLLEDTGIDTEELVLTEKISMTPEARKEIESTGMTLPLDVFADALAEEKPSIDLMPEDLKLRKSFRQKGKEMIVGAGLILIIFLLFAGIFLAKIYFRNGYLKEISQSFEAKEKETVELERLSEETRIARTFRQKRNRAIRVLDDFQKNLPKEMYLSEISMTVDGRVMIKGTSELMSIVFAFVTELENGPRFRNVTSDYTKNRKENDRDVSDFGLSMALEGAD